MRDSTQAKPRAQDRDRIRVYLYAAVAFLILGFGLTVLAVTVVNREKDRLVADAVDAVHQSGKDLAAVLGDLIRESGVDSFAALNPAEQRSALEWIKREIENESALTIYTLWEDDDVVYYIDRQGAEGGTLLEGDGETLLSAPPPMEDAVEIPIPVNAEGGGISNIRIRYDLSLQRVESSLKDSAQVIARTSWLLVAGLLVLLLGGIVILARVLAHLMALHDETNRLDRLAYVGTLSAGLAHEIRNPLNAMNINLDLIEDDMGTEGAADASTRQLVTRVKGQISHLNKVLENFLAYARPTRASGEIMDLSVTVRGALDAMRPELESRGVECDMVECEEPLPVEVDPTALHQALTNLILNAAQAMDKPERRITLKTSLSPNGACATIEDNGRGILPEELEKIFEVFYTGRQGGSGLGLPTAQRVIEDMGGHLEIDSMPGEGTRIVITLPLNRRRTRR